MQNMSYVCDSCGRRIEDLACPLVVTDSNSLLMLGIFSVVSMALPLSVRTMQQGRVDRCVACHAWIHHEDLVDATGVVVVAFADYTNDLPAFIAAAESVLQVARATVTRSTLEPDPSVPLINVLDEMAPQPSGDDAAATARQSSSS